MSRLRGSDALLLALAVLAAAIGWHWLDFVRVAHQVGQSEPPTLNIHWWWVHGFPYTRLEAFPRVFSPYGPVYQWLLALLPDVPGHPYLTGRILSLLATAGIFALVALWVRRRGGDGRAAALAVLLLWSTRPVAIFAPLYRVDMVGICLALGGYVAATQARRGWARLAGVLLLALAFHTKMSLLAAPLAMVAFWWPLDRKRAIGYGGLWLALAVLGVLALNHWTAGGFLANAYRSPAKWGKGFEVLVRPLFASPFWIMGLVALAARGRAREMRAEWCYLGAVALVTFVTGANWGASWNYLIELYIGLAVATGVLAGRWLRDPAVASVPPPCQGGGRGRSSSSVGGERCEPSDAGEHVRAAGSESPVSGDVQHRTPVAGRCWTSPCPLLGKEGVATIRPVVFGLLWLHVLYAAFYACVVVGAERGLLREYEATYQHARQVLEPYALTGREVALVDSYAGMDALLMLDRGNPLDLPTQVYAGRLDSIVAELTDRLRDGRTVAAFAGDDLLTWDPAHPLPPPRKTKRWPVLGFLL